MLNYSISLYLIFHALADPARRVIVERLSQGPASVSELAKPLAMSLPAVVQHLQVLETSGLVRSEKVTFHIKPMVLKTAEHWITERRASWEHHLDQLAVEQLRQETGKKYTFVALRLPYDIQHDEEDAQCALQFIQPDTLYTINIQPAVDSAVSSFEESTAQVMTDYNKGNQKAQQRMTVHYRIAHQLNLLVVGTDHAAEAVTGFFTKYGDGGVDITPLTGLTKCQGSMLLKELGTDERLYTKPPTADLLDTKPGQLDEDELSISYQVIDDYLEGHDILAEVARLIEHRYTITQHKRNLPITPFDAWWR